jgi:hypothetical protein
MNSSDEFENAKTLYKPVSAETVKPCSEDDPRRRKVMVALWERMGQLFGPQWETWYGTVDTQTIRSWQRSLAEFSEQELAGAIKACESWEEKFLPTYPQCRALCMSARAKLRPNWTAERIEREVPVAQLTAQRPADTELTREQKERIAAIQRGAEVETKEEAYRKLGLHVRWGAR